ncbi:MAG: GH92 family glycosyl hydrolase [Bacteroidales bacterium]|nr:GH92 family glycosyl hydrolase [Bacteroidales bacterium]
MMHTLFILLTWLLPFVNPFVGTDAHGHTFPGATYPFGMVQLSPDTRPSAGDWDGCSGYHYSDSLVYGFSHTHLSGTGCDDWCDLLVMPVIEYPMEDEISPEKYRSSFIHASESAAPGYYEVFLEKPGVLARLTVGRREGRHEYKFPAGSEPQIIVDLAHRDVLKEGRIEQTGERTFVGYRCSSSWSPDQKLYFCLEFSEPVGQVSISSRGCIIRFGKSRSGKLGLRVGISSVSAENARLNLSENDGLSFNSLLKRTQKAWNAYLSKLEAPSGSDRNVFYTALYHTAIHPSLYSDANGEYRGMDDAVHKAIGWDRYTVFSTWDTFRGEHPLLREIEPERTVDFLKTFLSIYREGGKLPVWELSNYETNCMIGYNSAPIIADALITGGLGLDMEAELLEALVTSSMVPAFGMDSFRANGAVLADDEHESVSKTLEYSYDDWCVAQVASHLAGRTAPGAFRDSLLAIRDRYLISAQYWRNVIDPETGFARARLNGRWLTPFNPREVNNHYTEANSWQYSFFVPHDIRGLIDLHGGEESFCRDLEALFEAPDGTTGRPQADITGCIGQYAHGNEPSHANAWLFAIAGREDLTQKRVSQILGTLYDAGPAGLCGNDDCGQMSAWYVLSALGRYPVCPGLEKQQMTEIPHNIVLNPVFEMDNDIFADSLSVSIKNINDGGEIWYRYGNDAEFKKYDGPFTVYEPCRMQAYVSMPDGRRSFVISSSVRKISSDRDITLFQRYNPQYNAGGDEGLIDGGRGALNWRTGGWQGYQGTDFTAVVDLREKRAVSRISAGFCQDARSWIWMPSEVVYSVSDDGLNYTEVYRETTPVASDDMTVQIWDCDSSVSVEARYVKVFARNFGTIPQWHPGAGYDAFIFIDEIMVD